MFSKYNIKLSVVAASLFCAVSAQAGGPATGGASEWTQIENNVQLVGQIEQSIQQTSSQLQMYQSMVKNLVNIPKMTWGNIAGDLAQVRNVVANGQHISYALQNADTVFMQRFPGYKPTTDYKGQYQAWSQGSMDGVRSAMNAAGVQSSQFATEQGTMQQLQAMSENSQGQHQALQVGNQIAVQQVQQIQKLRELQMAQMQAQNNYLAASQQTQDEGRVATESAFKSAGPQTPHSFNYQPPAIK